MATDSRENAGDVIYVSVSRSFSVTADPIPPDDDGTAGVREPVRPDDAPPSLSAEAAPTPDPAAS